MAKSIAKTYGEALFDLALEENNIDALTEEVEAVHDIFAQNEELIKLLNHPKISREEKVSVIEKVFKGRISDTIVGFLIIIVDKGRYNEINGIFVYYLDKVKEYRNIGVAYITSAITLNQDQKDKILQKLLQTTKYTQFELHFTVDKSILGGLIIRIGDRVVDSSIKNQLKNMTKALA